MWPWEHLALGYLCYSAIVWLRHRRPPGDAPVVAVAVATQAPDLVDKPLAWSVGVLPSGTTLAHSLLTATPVVALLVVVARRRGVPAVGAAFAVGYASHLLGDLLYPVLEGDALAVGFLFWPLVGRTGGEQPGLVAETARLFSEFVAFLGTTRGGVYLLLEGLFLLGVLALWRFDGWPGLWRSG